MKKSTWLVLPSAFEILVGTTGFEPVKTAMTTSDK